MNWTRAETASIKPKSGPKISAWLVGGGGSTLIVTLNRLAQDEYFGGSIVGERIAVDWAYSDGLPHLRLMRSEEGRLTAVSSMRGSARLSIARFGSGLPTEKTTSAPCEAVELSEGDGALVLALPETMRLPPLPPKR